MLLVFDITVVATVFDEARKIVKLEEQHILHNADLKVNNIIFYRILEESGCWVLV